MYVFILDEFWLVVLCGVVLLGFKLYKDENINLFRDLN